MSRFSLIITALMLFVVIPSYAINPDDLFTKYRKDKKVTVDSVHYTGSDLKKSPGGFVMQRYEGKGWTKGERLKIKNIKPKALKEVISTFQEWMDKGFGYGRDNWACIYFPSRKTFFCYEFSSDEQALWLLKATTDGDICVPGKWATVDYVDATEHNPFADADIEQIKQLGLARLWEGVNRWFVFRDKMTVNWDSLYVATMPKMRAAKTEQEWTDVLSEMIAHAHDGHTFIYGSNNRCPAPFTTVLIDSCVYVKSVHSENIALNKGERIVSVDGKPVLEYAEEKVIPYVASSTPQWTIHETFDGFGLLNRFPGDTVRVGLADGKEIKYVAGRQNLSEHLGSGEPFSVSYPSDNIAMLKIHTFMDYDGNFKKKFAAAYDSIRHSKALIIDLRGNGGGNSGNGDYILQAISNDSIPMDIWESPTSIPAFTSWGKTPDPYLGGGGKMASNPDIPGYPNPMVVLTDRGTFSAAEDFTVLFRSAKLGAIIGTPTGGSTGNGVNIELIPKHSWANICSKHDIAPDGTEFVGIGVQPDIVVEETWLSVFKDKTDRATSAAIKYLEKKFQRLKTKFRLPDPTYGLISGWVATEDARKLPS